MRTTRRDLVLEVCSRIPFTAEECGTVLEAMLQVIEQRAGRARPGREFSLEIRGFGRFFTRVRKRKPTARNPRTGSLVSVPARRVLLWKPAFRITFPEKGGPDGTN